LPQPRLPGQGPIQAPPGSAIVQTQVYPGTGMIPRVRVPEVYAPASTPRIFSTRRIGTGRQQQEILTSEASRVSGTFTPPPLLSQQLQSQQFLPQQQIIQPQGSITQSQQFLPQQQIIQPQGSITQIPITQPTFGQISSQVPTQPYQQSIPISESFGALSIREVSRPEQPQPILPPITLPSIQQPPIQQSLGSQFVTSAQVQSAQPQLPRQVRVLRPRAPIPTNP
jgi:hypothetical protein